MELIYEHPAEFLSTLFIPESIFPPVFGRRLQTQIVKTGERVVMDVEITGLPEPQVKWLKDDYEVTAQHPRYKLQQVGNCHKLIIENSEYKVQLMCSSLFNRISPPATKDDAGKFTVCASNPGGNAESIASFAVVDSTPDRIVEVVKTVVFEDPVDRTRKVSQYPAMPIFIHSLTSSLNYTR